MKKNLLVLSLLLSATVLFVSCGDDDAPRRENEEEVIDLVTLIFTPAGGGDPIEFDAFDSDGDGLDEDFELDLVELQTNTTYTLSIHVMNFQEGESITEEILEEAEEHMFFFEFTEGMFSNPEGNGNFDNRSDDVNYTDEDDNGNPIGQTTTWTTSANTTESGFFRVVLKHQPGVKSATSDSIDGETDIDITWTVNVTNPG